ncbi:glycerol-3-phosphate transporter [Raphidocelis subcapitata]|uniref:Glycerol-3-phosphate transporter n=1 Tax=Raphidocelis subcapitata TaxID=307507 RepID=A0A2V0NUI4_9CHLO|nr:glycerol-3-phosphate transporter [Raphidocelis subcapitata]|eukprot:GBF91304.1 glycerol-3-phosphate transporter [Raphidocelis subcapitata]
MGRASLAGKPSTPAGIEVLHAWYGRRFNHAFYKNMALVLTFLTYALFHATRKPPSVVKSVLKGDKQLLAGATAKGLLSEADVVSSYGWAPFNGPSGQSLLGQVDLAFLAAYAIGMFVAGHIGDRTDLRVFLAGGMVLSGLMTTLFGMAYFWDVHNMSYFIFIMILGGAFQSTGWPSVVSIMANWFGKGKRGLVMGVWNAHTSLGNIAGTVIASACLQYGWGYSFVVPGIAMSAMGVAVYLLLVVQPSDVGLPTAGSYESVKSTDEPQPDDDTSAKPAAAEGESVTFWEAWAIPGVASFALCLFFSKLIAYTFLYWLPYYIKSTPIQGQLLSARQAGDLSTLFDVGGVAGGILAGHLSDKTGASALVATCFTAACVPALWLYRAYGHMTLATNVALMMACGFLVNGPYALITTAVSADLGTHESLNGNAKALATVTAIIDGMGSIGAAIGPFLTGYIAEAAGFDGVFGMLYTSAILAGALLVRLVIKELQTLRLVSVKGHMRVPSGVQLTAKA